MTPSSNCSQLFIKIIPMLKIYATIRHFGSRKSTAGKVIRCLAAVKYGARSRFKIEEIEVEPPEMTEVRIKMIASGVSPTDLYNIGDFHTPGQYPVIRGIEGAGIVESVGDDVTKVKPGDHVIPVFLPQCNNCDNCKSGKTNLCSSLSATQPKGVMANGTSRFSSNGKTIHHFMGTSTFSQYTVCEEVSVCKINKKAPLEKVCLLGCSIPTGYGAAIKAAKVTKGSSCAVFGLGAVGLAAAMGCKAAGASKIYGIDINPSKEGVASNFGVTHFINPKKLKLKEKLSDYLKGLTYGGFDYTLECIGNAEQMRSAFECARWGWGTSCIVGVDTTKSEIMAPPSDFWVGRKWIGTTFGGYRNDDVAQLVEAYMREELMVDELITHTFPLTKINSAFELMRKSEGIHSVVTMSDVEDDKPCRSKVKH